MSLLVHIRDYERGNLVIFVNHFCFLREISSHILYFPLQDVTILVACHLYLVVMIFILRGKEHLVKEFSSRE